jgi:DNA-binding response OmpR family regulator
MNASLSDGNEPAIDIFILSANSPLSTQLEKQLRDEGYYVTLFSEGTHLLETLRTGKPNLLICDTTISEADAFEICRQIKADDYLWNIPVLIVTSASDLGDLLRVLDCNADNFIAHPFDPPYLLSLIEGMLTVPVERQTPEQIKTQFKIRHEDEVFVVTADRRKLLEFLLSSFEIAVNKSTNLSRAQEDIQNLAVTIRKLEENVQEHTKVIGIINETLKTKEQKLMELTGQLSDREQTVREKIGALDKVSRDLLDEKSSHAESRSEIQRVTKEKNESQAAHQVTIDQLQREVSGLSSELAIIKPALERTQEELLKESGQRKETEIELSTTTTQKGEAENALSALMKEHEALKVDFGIEQNRAKETEQELSAVLQEKTRSEQDLTQKINDLRATATQQDAVLTKLREESEAEIARLKRELESEHSRIQHTEENLLTVTTAKEQSEISLRTAIDAGREDLAKLYTQLDTAQSLLEDKDQELKTLSSEFAAVRSARESAEQELASVSRAFTETNTALEAETRNTVSVKEDLARVYKEKEKAESLAESLSGSLREFRDQLEQEKVRFRDAEERMNAIIRQRDQELRDLRQSHDDTRTALSSHTDTLEQMKQDLEAAVSARTDLEGKLHNAEEKIRQIGQELESTSEGREKEKLKHTSLADELEQVTTSLEKETLRRQEAEDQLRDALSQQQLVEQDLERVVSETKLLHADLAAERKMHETSNQQNRFLEEQITVLSREKLKAEQVAANLTAEIDQARVALADEWEDHMTDNERLTAVPAKKQQLGQVPFSGVKKEAEIIKKRSLIVKVPTIPSEIRPLPRSMVAIDPVKASEPETSHIRSVEDLFEDDEGAKEKTTGTRPVVSIIEEPATEPVHDVLPDIVSDRSDEQEIFFENEVPFVPGTENTIGEDDTDNEDSPADESDTGAPVSGENVAFNRTQWLELLRWSHHCDDLTPDQRMQIVRMGRLIQKGRKLTKKQEEQVLEMIALVQRLGYRIT